MVTYKNEALDPIETISNTVSFISSAYLENFDL